MPWDEEIDPAMPGPTDPAEQGDDQIRNLKEALNERMDTLTGPSWPDDDPLYVRGAIIGLDAARPNPATWKDGVVYITTDTRRLYYTASGVWVELPLQSTVTPPPPPPEYSTVTPPNSVNGTTISTCLADVPTYEMLVEWVDTVNLANTQIFIDGVLVATVAYDVETREVALTGGAKTYILGVRHELDGEFSPMITQSVTIPNPCVTSGVQALASFNAVDASVCDAGPSPRYEVALSWVRQDPAAAVRIKLNGTQIVYLDSNIPSPVTHVLNPQAAGTFTYEAFQVVGGVEGPPISRAVTVVNPCTAPSFGPPSNLQVFEVGGGAENPPGCVGGVSVNVARVSWLNTAAQQTRIYRGGVLQATLGAGITQYEDNTVIHSTPYQYWATHYNAGTPFESAASAIAYYTGEDGCA